MVQRLETIRGGGGSIKIGTTGTINTLMSRELDCTKSGSKAPSLSTSVAGLSDDTTKKMKPGASAGEASSRTGNIKNPKDSETTKRMKLHGGHTHQIPMLTSDGVSVDATPIRQKPIKKGSNVVEIVDIKCGHSDRNWVNPITNRLKKLGFSKLTESTI